MANLFTPGWLGRIRGPGGTVTGVKSWQLPMTTSPIPIPNFESPVDALGRIWPLVLPGLSGASGSLEGYFDSDPTNVTDGALTQFNTGVYLDIDFIVDKDTGWGFTANVLVTNFGPNVTVDNQPATFSLQFTVNGAVPVSAIIA